MIKTADTDYVADYDSDCEKPIKKPMFWPKSPKIDYLTLRISEYFFFVIRLLIFNYSLPQKVNFLWWSVSAVPIILTDTDYNRYLE